MVYTATTIAPDKPYSSTHVSVEDEMIQRFSHSHPLYKADNATIYARLVIATLGSQYESTIDTFKIANNSCEEINALKSQFYGAAHWYIEVKVQMDLLLNGRCNGQTAITQHKFPAKHRASFHYL